MPINVDHPHVLNLCEEYRAPNRWDSAAFLMWYLEKYYRLDKQEALDSVCDKRNDKGVDGIWIDEDDQTITVFQSKIIESPRKTIGDGDLRPFAGTLRQFETVAGLEAMIQAAGMAQVATLVKRLDLSTKIDTGTYSVRGEFLANINIDANGKPYLKAAPNITFIGKDYLESRYISDERDLPVHPSVTFDIKGYAFSEHKLDKKTRAVIVPVRASELVTLSGIADQSLFAQNVRGPLGKTPINKAIVGSLKDKALHKAFPLFHNGITVISSKLTASATEVKIQDYYVVNGCQSLTALYENQNILSKDLRILTKFIILEKDSPLAATITKFSNNQNGVRARDFMSNNPMQVRLQNDFAKHYKDQYYLEIKRGEEKARGIRVTNEAAGLYLMAFDLKEPWATHRQYQVFGDKHTEIFGKPQANSHRVVMCQVIMDGIVEACANMRNKLCAKYVLTRYFIMYVIRLMIDDDPIARELLATPEKFVQKAKDRQKFSECMRSLADEIVVDLNAELEPLGVDFDYRDKMRDQSWVVNLANQIVGLRLKYVQRNRIETIKALLEKAN